MPFDPVHKVPRSLIFWSDFLYFVIKKQSFGLFGKFFEGFPVINQFQRPVVPKLSLIFIISPIFGPFGNFNTSQILILDGFWYSCIFLNNKFQRVLVKNFYHIYVSYSFDKIGNEILFFFTILDNSTILNEFFSNRDINS